MWGLAGAFGGRVLLRMEDHDRSRSRPEFEASILRDLAWLGFEADAPPARQSERGAIYDAALRRLEGRGLVYACACSRREIEATSARLDDPVTQETPYAGTCRDRRLDPGTVAARRIRLADDVVEFVDLRLGPGAQRPSSQCGDVLARDRRGNWTYQFAVVVDDLDQRVDVVVRGEDLLTSTGRQVLLARMLGRAEPPRFLHHPLVLRPDGTKLSKSNRDQGIGELRDAGVSAARVLEMAAAAGGLARELDRGNAHGDALRSRGAGILFR